MTMPHAAVIQMNSGPDRDVNLAVAGKLLAQAAAQGAVLVALPENFALMGRRERDKLAIAEADGSGPIQDFLAQRARELGLWIVGGTLPIAVADDPDHVYAACCVYDSSGARVARYDKIHLFDVDVPNARGERYRESASIAAGAPQPVVVDTPLGRLGLSVCYDVRFAELYRALVAQGAELLCVPAAFTEPTGRAHWEVMLRARAIENLCHVLAPGQCGVHPGERRTYGHSCIVEPWGSVLADGGTEPGVAVAPIDAERRATLRREFPVLGHRRLS